MTERDALLKAIEESPRDVTRRLVYADHLDESGEPPAAALVRVLAEPEKDDRRLAYADVCEGLGDGSRAAFIRVQVELAGTDCPACSNTGVGQRTITEYREGLGLCGVGQRSGLCPACGPLRRRQGELLTGPNYSLWSGEALRPILTDRIAERILYDRRDLPERPFEFIRGFVERVTCPAADWLAHADAITAAHPVRAVRLTTWPDVVAYLSRNGQKRGLLGVPDRAWWVRFFAEEWPGIAFELPPAELPPLHPGQTLTLPAGWETTNPPPEAR